METDKKSQIIKCKFNEIRFMNEIIIIWNGIKQQKIVLLC